MKTFTVDSISFSSDATVKPKYGSKAALNLRDHPASGRLKIDDYFNLSGTVVLTGVFNGRRAKSVTTSLFDDMKKLFGLQTSGNSKVLTLDINVKMDSYETISTGVDTRWIKLSKWNAITRKMVLIEIDMTKVW